MAICCAIDERITAQVKKTFQQLEGRSTLRLPPFGRGMNHYGLRVHVGEQSCSVSKFLRRDQAVEQWVGFHAFLLQQKCSLRNYHMQLICVAIQFVHYRIYNVDIPASNNQIKGTSNDITNNSKTEFLSAAKLWQQLIPGINLHGLSCKDGTGRSAWHYALNDLLWRALFKADIPAVKEASGLLRTDGKRLDGVTQLLWRTGKCVTWDVTVIDTLASSYVPATSQTPGAAAQTAGDRKTSKYAILSQSYLFVPVAVETMGAINEAGMNFLGDFERRITKHTDDHHESAFLYQRISTVIQRFNAVAVLGTFAPQPPRKT